MAFAIARFVGQRYACAHTGISPADAQRATEQRFVNTLQQAGLIRYSRGHFEILNLEGLQDASEAICQERSAFGWNSGAKSALAVCSAKGVEYGCE